jgi:hypothetical protein
MKIRVKIITVFLVACAGLAQAATITVGPGAGYDFNTIQAAIDAATDGDVVIVATGTYTGNGNRDIDFNGKAITVRSTDPNDPDIVEATVIDCDGTESEPHRGFYFHSGEDPNSVVAGLKITRGYADEGGGMYFYGGSPAIIKCMLRDNSSLSRGAALACRNSEPSFDRCELTENETGGIFCFESLLRLTGCSFIENKGGAIDSFDSEVTVSKCIFIRNSMGGAIENHNSTGVNYPRSCKMDLSDCTFIGNSARNGGAIDNYQAEVVITNCIFKDNSSLFSGGAIYNHHTSQTITNCLFLANRAGDAGGAISNYYQSSLMITNCTFIRNSAESGGAIRSIRESHPTVTNCILWDNAAAKGDNLNLALYSWAGITYTTAATITYSNVQGGEIAAYVEPGCTLHWGTGNIDADPWFVDADGADNVFGTEDDNPRLLDGSPCIDAGNNLAIPPSVLKDSDGNLRIRNGIVDMGAYEFQEEPGWYVDVVNGSDENNGLNTGTAFATIQMAIEQAVNGNTILVYPGVYHEQINFLGKAITVRSIEEPAVLEAPGSFAVSFYMGEGPNSILKNFVIRNSYMGIFIAHGSPTLSNLTIADNKSGIEAYADSEPDISNCILWNNTDCDLFGCQARYSCLETANPGQHNLNIDPLFVDPNNGDYHLLSERGRYWSQHDVWVLDKVTSPYIDGGDPNVDPSDEPMPNGGRINIGAYGGTAYASMKQTRWLDGDINHNELVDMIDLAILADNWLRYEPPTSNELPAVNITKPENRAVFILDSAPVPIEIEAKAWDSDGLVVKVEFFADGTKISEDEDGSDGWKIIWSDWPDHGAGLHSLTVRATDDDGGSVVSPVVEIIATYPGPRYRPPWL